MVGEGTALLVEGQPLPGGGHHLVPGVSPGVGEVEVNHQSHAEAIGAHSLGYHVGDAVPVFVGVDPYAQTDRIDTTVVAEQLHTLHLVAVIAGGVEVQSLGFHPG